MHKSVFTLLFGALLGAAVGFLWFSGVRPVSIPEAAPVPSDTTELAPPSASGGMASVEGFVIDLSCAARSRAVTASWGNIGPDHVMAEDGTHQEGCLELCLKNGQPAGIFFEEELQAVLACNPAGGGKIQRGDEHGNPHALTKYADGSPVVVEGFWADERARLLVPVRIRRRVMHAESFFDRGGWHPVDCNRDGVPFSGSDSLLATAEGEHAHH